MKKVISKNNADSIRNSYSGVRQHIETAIRGKLTDLKKYARKSKQSDLLEICIWIESPNWKACPYFHINPTSDDDPRCAKDLSDYDTDFRFTFFLESDCLNTIPLDENLIYRVGWLWPILEESVFYIHGMINRLPSSAKREKKIEECERAGDLVADIWPLLKIWENIYCVANYESGEFSLPIHSYVSRALSIQYEERKKRTAKGGDRTQDKSYDTHQLILDMATELDPHKKRSANSLAEELSLTLRIKKMIPDPQNKGGNKPTFQAKKGCSKSNIAPKLSDAGWPARIKR